MKQFNFLGFLNLCSGTSTRLLVPVPVFWYRARGACVMSRSYDGRSPWRSGGAVQKLKRTAKQSLIKMAACQAAIRLMTRFGLYLQGTKKHCNLHLDNISGSGNYCNYSLINIIAVFSNRSSVLSAG